MLKTPPLRVSRPVSACSRCRAAKIRCDGKLPACTACERAGKASDCSSGNDQFARGKERSYVASLETRVERLERQLHYRRHGQPVISISRRPSVYPVTEAKVSSKGEASDVDELVSDFGHMAVHATSNAYHGFDREMSLARLLLSTAMVNELPRITDHPLPSRSVAIDLLNACVVSFFTLYPIMSFAALLGALERVYHPSGRLASPQDIWNVRICLAIGLSARSKAKGDLQYESGVMHVAVAVETVGETIIAPGSIANLRSLMLLVLYSTTNPAYLSSWYLMGMAARFMAEMGLHDVKARSDDRRSLFMLVYGLDRHVSMSRLQPFSFSDESADLTLPGVLTPPDLQGLGQGAHDDAKMFVQIQQDQSAWYQSVFFSDHKAMHQSYITRLASIHANHAWLSKLPEGPLRSRFAAQVLYGSILLMLPLETSTTTMSSYGKALTLEYICSYADALEGLTSQNEDYLRTSIVGQRFLQLAGAVDGPAHVLPVANTDELQSPSLTWTMQGGVVARTIETLQKLDRALVWLNGKYDHGTAYRRWKEDSDLVLQALCQPAAKW